VRGVSRHIGEAVALAASAAVGLVGLAANAEAGTQYPLTYVVPGALVAPTAPFPAPTAFASSNGGGMTYGGSSSQEDPIVLRLSRDHARVAMVAVDWEASCTSGLILASANVVIGSATAPRLDKLGRFRGMVAPPPEPFGSNQVEATSETFAGRVTLAKASGTFRAQVTITSAQTGAKLDFCDTGTLRWTMPPHQERIYGGLTTQGEPVVVQTDAKRNRLSLIRIGWFAPCDDGAVADVGDVFTDFPLSRSGEFGDAFPGAFGPASGTHGKLQYEIYGKLGASHALGTFQVTDTVFDGTGGTLRTCSSPTVRWSAQQ
jgi:hypothetical protein